MPLSQSPSDFFGPGIGPVAYGDRSIWHSHLFTTPPGSRFQLVFVRSRAEPRQGLRLSCVNKRHTLRINDIDAAQFVLWADTAPQRVEVAVSKGRQPRQIRLLNVWELPDYGTTMQGINAACMSVSHTESGSVLLECSDGYGVGPPDFTDLVVRIILDSTLGAPTT